MGEPSYGLPQRPPLMPFAPASGSTGALAAPTNCRTMEADMFSGSGSSSLGRPPSLGSNSRPTLGAHQGAASSTLQAPWATADGPQQQMSQAPRRGGPPSSSSGSGAAGQYSRGNGRSASMPCTGHARTSGDSPLTGCAFEALP